jgi:hypothetical protein
MASNSETAINSPHTLTTVPTANRTSIPPLLVHDGGGGITEPAGGGGGGGGLGVGYGFNNGSDSFEDFSLLNFTQDDWYSNVTTPSPSSSSLEAASNASQNMSYCDLVLQDVAEPPPEYR